MLTGSSLGGGGLAVYRYYFLAVKALLLNYQGSDACAYNAGALVRAGLLAKLVVVLPITKPGCIFQPVRIK